MNLTGMIACTGHFLASANTLRFARSIAKIYKSDTTELTDIYTILYTDGYKDSFVINHGVSITNITINAENHLLINLSNGTEVDAGVIDVDTAVDNKLAEQKGSAKGVAELDENGKVPSAQLPSYVDDVLEYDNQSAFPSEGESGKIYIAQDTNKTYRWGGTAYAEISASLALGETSSTAYRGDKGKAAYEHSQKTSGNPHGVTKSDIGLNNVDNTSDLDKPVSVSQKAAIDAKYTKPTGGIPKADLATDVQTSLGRADELTDSYIDELINAKLGVIENGNY